MIEPTARENGAPVSEEYVRALNAHGRIIAAKAATEQSLYDLCSGLKEVHDNKYYKVLGYSSFEEYTQTEHGITRQQGARMIKAIETYEGAKNVKSTLHFGSTEKFYLLSTLSEETRAEIVESTDIESATVRELKGRIKALTEQAEQAEERVETLKKSENKAWGEVSRLKTDSEMRGQKITELEAEIKELEARPVEVAVSREEENLRKAIRKMNDDFDKEFAEQEEQNMKDRRELMQVHEREVEQLRAEYEKKLAEIPAESGGKAAFKAYLANAIDAAERLYKFLCENPDPQFAAQAVKFTEMISKKIGDVKI